jgi:hypothetical protein
MQRPYLSLMRVASLIISAAPLLVLLGCANEEVFLAVDHAKCRQLGFTPGGAEYNSCISQVARRRTNLAAAPEPLKEDYTAAVPTVRAKPPAH